MNKYEFKDGDGWVFKLFDHIICLVFLPFVIIGHLWHLWCALLSTGAVLLADVVSTVTGREYPQYVDFYWDDPNHSDYADMPRWYVWFIADVNNYITTFHEWMVDTISPEIDDDGDDDDFTGGDIVPVDEHEELIEPK